jgi:Holliday junction resolvasome RuvABC ATP-dependent DNA helicase subunit
MLVGPDGVGKTTLAQQLALGQIGLRERVLGMRVETIDRPLLYIAAD